MWTAAALPGPLAASVLAEPVLLQTMAEREPGPVEDDPQVGRCNAQFLTNLGAVEIHYLPHHEDAGRIGRKLFQAEIYHVEKLASGKVLLRIAPCRRCILPVTRLIEQGVK